MDVSEPSKRRLFEDAGEAHAALLHCPSCRSILASHHFPHPSFSWGLVLACGKCSTRWVVCTLCSSMRKHMLENSSAPQCHNETKHGGMTTPGNVARINPMKATTHNPEASSPQYVSETAAPPQKFPLDLFSRPENCKFFKQQANGHGIGYLVGLANFGKDNISSLLDPADIDMFLTLAHYCSTQTRPQREQLAEVLLKTIQSTYRHLEATSISSAATLSLHSSHLVSQRRRH